MAHVFFREGFCRHGVAIPPAQRQAGGMRHSGLSPTELREQGTRGPEIVHLSEVLLQRLQSFQEARGFTFFENRLQEFADVAQLLEGDAEPVKLSGR